MNKRIVILTGNDLRHQFFRKKLALTNGIEVVQSFCETVKHIISEEFTEETKFRHKHLEARHQSEKDFFELYLNTVEDKSNPIVIERGTINDEKYPLQIAAMNIDLVIVYGASILKKSFLHFFPNKILNVHLGLSPYYRGAGTNYWPLVDGLPESNGATFMFINEGIDTGEIIHQIRATYYYSDSSFSIGNRLIEEMTHVFANLILKFDSLQKPPLVNFNPLRKFCKNADFSEESVKKLHQNFANNMIEMYLNEKEKRDLSFPIQENPLLFIG